jgi:hypothetical protein
MSFHPTEKRHTQQESGEANEESCGREPPSKARVLLYEVVDEHTTAGFYWSLVARVIRTEGTVS